MNILYISPRFEGGIGGHAKRVSIKLNENGFNVELMQIPTIPIKNLKNPSFTIFGTFKTILTMKSYDIVHAWNVPSGIIMKNICAKTKVLSIHGIYSQQISSLHSKSVSKIGLIAEKKAIRNSNILTTDSRFVQKSYEKNFNKKTVYLPAPLDTEIFHSIKETSTKKNQIVFIGRDSYEKGIDILKKIEPDLNIKVVYCTDYDWIDAMNELKQSILLIVPSRHESIPQVIKEAFYLKIPVIATNVGGIPELIEHEKTGILVQSENSNELKIAINNLLNNPELQNHLSDNAYKFIKENFVWEKLLQKYLNFYNSFT